MRYIINFVLCLIWLAYVWGFAGLARVPYAFVGWVIGFIIFEAVQHRVHPTAAGGSTSGNNSESGGG